MWLTSTHGQTAWLRCAPHSCLQMQLQEKFPKIADQAKRQDCEESREYRPTQFHKSLHIFVTLFIWAVPWVHMELLLEAKLKIWTYPPELCLAFLCCHDHFMKILQLGHIPKQEDIFRCLRWNKVNFAPFICEYLPLNHLKEITCIPGQCQWEAWSHFCFLRGCAGPWLCLNRAGTGQEPSQEGTYKGKVLHVSV